MFLGKATGDLFSFILFALAICFGFLFSRLLHLLLSLFDWRKPNQPDALPIFEPRRKTL